MNKTFYKALRIKKKIVWHCAPFLEHDFSICWFFLPSSSSFFFFFESFLSVSILTDVCMYRIHEADRFLFTFHIFVPFAKKSNEWVCVWHVMGFFYMQKFGWGFLRWLPFRLKACERVCVRLIRNWELDIRESFSFSNVSFDEHFMESRKSFEVSWVYRMEQGHKDKQMKFYTTKIMMVMVGKRATDKNQKIHIYLDI